MGRARGRRMLLTSVRVDHTGTPLPASGYAGLATLVLTADGCENAPDGGPDPAPAESGVNG
jgi:hypothetical protein